MNINQVTPEIATTAPVSIADRAVQVLGQLTDRVNMDIVAILIAVTAAALCVASVTAWRRARARELALANQTHELQARVTRQEAAQKHLRHLAYYDSLTGLPNEALFRDRLGSALHAARRNNEQVAVMYVNLDRFGEANNALGRALADRLLASIADSLGRCVRDMDTLARLLGDEFAILVPELKDDSTAIAIAERLLSECVRGVTAGDVRVRITPSIGIALFPGHGEDPEQLIDAARDAMQQVKHTGGRGYATVQSARSAGLQPRQDADDVYAEPVPELALLREA